MRKSKCQAKTMPEKLVIRVINAQSLDQNELKKEPKRPKEVVVYYWNRIFAALLVLIALLAGLIWGGLHGFKKPSGDKPPASAMRAANPVETAPAPSVDTSSSPKSAPKTAADASAITSVSILSSGIKRAQLTSGIKEDEPVDNIGQIIPMNDKGLIRVYFFMETVDLRGRVFFHDWYWKGKRMAHVRIPIKRNADTAASSKFIDRIMVGPWEVRIVDNNNRVLAKAAFEVR